MAVMCYKGKEVIKLISLYSGTNGSGKSLHAMRYIIAQLKAGRNVITNFDIDVSGFKKLKGKHYYVNTYDLSVKFLKIFAYKHHDLTKQGKEGQTLVVVDECQRKWNTRDFGDTDRRSWLNFLPEHRKYRFNFLMIAPYDRMIDRQIRALFEYEVVHRKANNYKIIGLIFTIIGLPVFIAINYWYGMKAKCDSTWFIYSKKYGNMYNTFTIFDKHDEIEKYRKLAEDEESAPDDGAGTLGGTRHPEQIQID